MRLKREWEENEDQLQRTALALSDGLSGVTPVWLSRRGSQCMGFASSNSGAAAEEEEEEEDAADLPFGLVRPVLSSPSFGCAMRECEEEEGKEEEESDEADVFRAWPCPLLLESAELLLLAALAECDAMPSTVMAMLGAEPSESCEDELDAEEEEEEVEVEKVTVSE